MAQGWLTANHFWDGKITEEEAISGFYLLPCCSPLGGRPDREWRLAFSRSEVREIVTVVTIFFVSNVLFHLCHIFISLLFGKMGIILLIALPHMTTGEAKMMCYLTLTCFGDRKLMPQSKFQK